MLVDEDLKGKVELPRNLHLCTTFALRFPFTAGFLTVLEAGGAFGLLLYTSLPSVGASASTVGLIALAVLGVTLSAVRVSSRGLLGDLVGYVGEPGSSACLAWAEKEVRAGVFPFVVVGALPLLCYFVEIRHHIETKGDVEKGVIYGCVAGTTLVGPFLAVAAFTGCVEIVRLVAALLKAAIRRHFENLEAVLTSEGSQEGLIRELDRDCKRVNSVFKKANNCLTFLIFSSVVTANMTALVSILQLVVVVRTETYTLFAFLYFGGVITVAIVTGMSVLHSITTVADEYEDLAANLSHNINVRFKLTNAFPGPAGVKLLTSFQTDHVNELSFNFHHRPLDARVMEGTLIKLFMGAVVTICLGILTR